MLKKLILEGQIPYFNQIRKLIFVLAITTPLAIFWMPNEFGEFGEIGWQMLIGLMLIRPLADFFPKIKILRSLVPLRKEVGEWSAFMILAHFVGYVMVKDVSVIDWVTSAKAWDLSGPMGWGTVGTVAMIPVLITSNKFSIIKLKKWWKRVQKLTYLFFLAGGIHIALLGNDETWIAIGVVATVTIAASIKKRLSVIPKLKR